MNPKQKRYRQISIFESFGQKRPKSADMTENSQIKSPSLSVAAAERLKAFPTTVPAASENQICFAAEHSIKIENDDDVDSAASILKTDSEKMSCEDENVSENSADLFPESTSQENYSIPSSSGSAELFVDESDSQSQAASDDDESDELFACFTNERSSSQEPHSYEDDDPLKCEFCSCKDALSFLNRSPDCNIPLPKLEPLENHSIMFSPHIRPGDAPRPYPSIYKDKWDFNHVRMPCSPMNIYPVDVGNGPKEIQNRWDIICRSLRRDIGSSKDLEAAIMKYNFQYVDRWNFQGLHIYINRYLSEAERDHFFEVILPAMIEMALNLPNICTQPVPLLKKRRDHHLTMTQKQIGCLLLNAFFCTFPRRTLSTKRNRHRDNNIEYESYPDINFNRLFAGVKNDILPKNAEKLKCLFNYFRRITSEVPTGTVTFHRQHLHSFDLPKWNESTRGIRYTVIKSAGLIETDGHGMLQVDFANKFVGGGVLGHGCVQEEIRFVICTELIVSRLFTECLNYNEVLIVTGAEQYNEYSGYADNFKWEGDFRDVTPRDSWGRRYTEIVAMDATYFSDPADQFKPSFIRKELAKAYCGFYENALPDNTPAIATGNWGCGAFKGDANLKFLIQLMAASEARRSLLYFTFGNKKLKTDLQNMYDFLIEKNLVVGDIWRLLISYFESVSFFRKSSNIYEFIYSQFLTKEDNCRQ